MPVDNEMNLFEKAFLDVIDDTSLTLVSEAPSDGGTRFVWLTDEGRLVIADDGAECLVYELDDNTASVITRDKEVYRRFMDGEFWEKSMPEVRKEAA